MLQLGQQLGGGLCYRAMLAQTNTGSQARQKRPDYWQVQLKLKKTPAFRLPVTTKPNKQ